MEEKKKKKPESNLSKNIKAIVILAFGVFLFFTVVYNRPHPTKEQIYKIRCMGKLKSLVLAYYIYEDENEEWPDSESWCDSVKPYLIGNNEELNEETYLCPADKVGPCSYAMNENIPADANELPDDLILLFESAPGWNQVGGVDDVVTDRHKRPGTNIAFADGHVEFVKSEDIPNLQWTVD